MSAVLDAQDALARATDLVRLIGMTTICNPDDEQKAISAGCEAILAQLKEAEALLRSVPGDADTAKNGAS